MISPGFLGPFNPPPPLLILEVILYLLQLSVPPMAPQTQTEQSDRSVDSPFVLGQEMVQVDDKVYSATELARSHPGRVSIAYEAIGSLP